MTAKTRPIGIEGGSAVVPVSDRLKGSAFPWERVQTDEESNEVTRELNSVTHAISDEKLNIADWMTGMHKPKYPVHEIFSKYSAKSAHTNLEKGQIISGLSYCANRRTVGQVAGAQRSRGSVDDANSLLDVNQDYIKYCGGLNDSAFSLRKNILAELAESGDAEAKMLYFEAGPLGRWPTSNEHIPLTQDEIASWNKTAVQFLEQAAKEGDLRSYKTLASMYGASKDDPILGSLSNQSTSYAYELLWISSLQSNHETSKELKDSLNNYMSYVVDKFTPEQRREGMKKAAQIQSNLK
ncbi:hypothetical protein [Paracidovorax valerianellae]|nr:hypothetical protein [Paracidovorax valerianellae]MDA8444167.1 hypothetical protein [Paracidovorax valerianellae]